MCVVTTQRSRASVVGGQKCDTPILPKLQHQKSTMTRLEPRANAMICALTQRLLLLSGDVELNPGPDLDLGRCQEGGARRQHEAMICTCLCIDTDSTPTLLYLEEMRVNGKPLKIIQEIAAQGYIKFGMHLLRDEDGKEVRVIGKNHKDDVEDVVRAIIEKWLASSEAPRTYQHLIECLRLSELGALADLIANEGMLI